MISEKDTTILVVDDEEQILDWLQGMLSIEGYQVLTASSAFQALELLEKHHLDLIISDVNMPKMNGYEFYRRVKDQPRLQAIPFVFLSALCDTKDVIAGKELGADDYLSKPISAEELLATIKGKLKRAEQMRASVNTELTELKNQILQTLSHEFRTPLATIRGFSSILLDERIHYSPLELEEFLKIIKTGGDRLQRLVEDFLLTVSTETGEMQKYYEAQRCPTNLLELIEEATAKLTPAFQEKRVSLEKRLPEGLPSVTVSPREIEEILERLLSNALKFTPSGGKVEVSAVREGQQVILKVSDSGIGIPPQEMPRIFDKFYQVDRVKMEQQGAGLGLYIAKQFAHINHCTLECESEVGKGSTFSLKIPIA